jgi:hypothetical protein
MGQWLELSATSRSCSCTEGYLETWEAAAARDFTMAVVAAG